MSYVILVHWAQVPGLTQFFGGYKTFESAEDYLRRSGFEKKPNEGWVRSNPPHGKDRAQIMNEAAANDW